MSEPFIPEGGPADGPLGRRTGTTMVWGQVSKTLEGLLAIATAVAAVRALNPNAFGLYSLLTYFAGSASVFIPIVLVEAAGGVLPRFREKSERLSLAAMIAILRLSIIAVAVVLLTLTWTSFRDAFGLDAISVRVFLVGAAYWAAQDLLNSLSSYYTIELDLRVVALWKPVGQLVSLSAIVYVAATQDRWESSVGEVLVAVTLGYAVSVAGLLFSLRHHWPPRAPARANALTVLGYTRHTWLIGLMSLALSTHIDVLLIGAITDDPVQVGFYAAAFGIVIRAQIFVLSGWAAPIIPSLSRALIQGGLAGFGRVWQLFTQLWLFVSVPVMTIMLVLAQPLVDTLFGAEYAPAGGLLAWAAAFSLGYGIATGPLGTNALWALDRQKIVSRIKFVAALLNLALAAFLISRHGALGAIIGTGLATFATALVEYLVAARYGKLRYPIGFALRIGGAAAAAAAPALIVRPEAPIGLLACGTAGVALYVAGCALLRPFSAQDLVVLQRASPRLAASPLRLFARS